MMKFVIMPFVLIMLPIAFIFLTFKVAYDFLDGKLLESYIGDSND